MTKERFEQFLATGELKAEGGKLFMQRGDLTALADMARNEILTLRQNPAASAPAPARSATTPAVKPAAITPPAPVTKPATAPAAAKPAVPAITGTVTAAQFRAEQSKPTMTGAEFRSLSHTERNEWIRSGGKVAD